jgi:hypothetical protein
MNENTLARELQDIKAALAAILRRLTTPHDVTGKMERRESLSEPPTSAILEGCVGHHIRDICNNGFTSDADNHCAHFVSHVLKLSFGYTCRTATGGPNPGGCLRVQEVFAQCIEVGTWDNLPAPLNYGAV